MCKQLFDNGNGELVETSVFIRDNVLDTEGFEVATQCPNCGKQASERQFDECLGGAINQVTSLDCEHCGYHECSQEFCHICEAQIEASIMANKTELNKDMDDGNHLTLIAEYIIDCVSNKGRVNGISITYLKLILVNNPSASQFFDLDNEGVIRGYRKAVSLLKKHVLNAKFNHNLEKKITLAMEELV